MDLKELHDKYMHKEVEVSNVDFNGILESVKGEVTGYSGKGSDLWIVRFSHKGVDYAGKFSEERLTILS